MIFKDQKHFMTLAGQTTDQFNYPQFLRYKAHILEETNELTNAFEPVKIIDSLIDLLVVTIGALYSLGVDPQPCWDAVHKANLSKVDGSLGPVQLRPDGQIGKPPGWVGPEKTLFEICKQYGLVNDEEN